MSVFRYFFVGILCLMALESKADRIKSALKLLEKKEFEKARENLDKEFEKDSASAGASYVYAVFFVAQDNPSYNIDSAYFFINQALIFYPSTEDKLLEDLNKININDSSLNAEKLYIEKLAFEKAKKINKIQSFQYFIDNYKTALQIEEAVEARNALAWEEASQKNTKQSYSDFMQNFPQARQFPQAKDKYDRFIIDKEIKSRTLKSYQDFVKKYPDNEHIKEAEWAIYEMSTTEHSIISYTNFVNQNPDNYYVTRAYDWLLVFYLEEFNATIFAKQYPNFYDKDYLNQKIEAEKQQYVPILEEGSYTYIDQNGEASPIDYFSNIPEEHRCESVAENFFVIETEQGKGLMDKTGKVIIAPRYEAIEYFDIGLFEVVQKSKKGLFHIQGYEILDTDFQSLKFVNSYFLAFQKDNFWGLSTFNGRLFLKEQFEEVFSLGSRFIVFKKNEKYGVASNQFLQKNLFKDDLKVKTVYDSVALLSENYVLVFKDGQKTAINLDGKEILPFTELDIQSTGFAWAVGTDSSGYQVFSENASQISKDTFALALGNEEYLVAKKNEGWGFFNQEGKLVKAFEYDTVFFLADIVFYQKEKELWAEFLGQEDSINLSEFEQFSVQFNENEQLPWILFAEDERGKLKLFSPEGKALFEEKYPEIFWIEPNFFTFKQNRKYGLLGLNGKVILKPYFDGISNLDEKHFGLLYQRKFGLLRKKDTLYIQPKYDVLLQPYFDNNDNNFFIAQYQGNVGMIDAEENTIVPFEFEAVKKWQKEKVIIQQEGEWYFYDFAEQKIEEENSFQEIEFVKQSDEENIIITLKEDIKYGARSSIYGELLPTEYDFIYNLGTQEAPILVGERKLAKNQYEIIYVNREGKKIWQKNLPEKDFLKIVCE